jgi:hypothetical protein
MIEISSMIGNRRMTPFRAVEAGVIQLAAFAGQIQRTV